MAPTASSPSGSGNPLAEGPAGDSAVFSGPSATIQNAPPPRSSEAESILLVQRLAARALVYVEAHSGRPLEIEAADLYV
jgi:hypothetical protein